jgi:deoxyribodipyrimidine photo-lyase
VASFLKKSGIVFSSFKDQVVFEKDEVIKPNGEPYTILPLIQNLEQKLSDQKIPEYNSAGHLGALLKTPSFRFHSLKHIGFNHASYDFDFLTLTHL